MFKKTIMIILGSIILFVGSDEVSNNKVNDYVVNDGFTTNDFPDQH